MSQIVNNFREISSPGNFESEVERLLRQISNQTISIGGETSFKIAEKSFSDVDFANILISGTKNRITSGLKSLELISIIRSGTDQRNLFLFDNVIFYGKSSDFDTSDINKLINIVTENVGMSTVINFFDDITTKNFKDLAIKIAMLVKTGKYTSDRYAIPMQIESRTLTKRFIGLQK